MVNNIRFTGQIIECVCDHTTATANLSKIKPITSFAPDPDKSYADNQAAWVKLNKIEKGSKVKVVRKAKDYENDYESIYNTNKDRFVGEMSEITGISNDWLCAFGWCWPYFVLEPVK